LPGLPLTNGPIHRAIFICAERDKMHYAKLRDGVYNRDVGRMSGAIRAKKKNCSECDKLPLTRLRAGVYSLHQQRGTNMNTKEILTATIAPLRKLAVDRAVSFAQKDIERIRAIFAEAGNDFNIAAPYPKVTEGNYQSKLQYRNKISRFVTTVAPTYRMNEPRIVKFDDKKISEYLTTVAKIAGEQFDMYVGKLANKVGDIKSAQICGTELWFGSTLTVTTPAGTIEKWLTKHILNMSKYHLVFSQFPTRKMK